MTLAITLLILIINSGNIPDHVIKCGTYKVDTPTKVEQAYLRYLHGFKRYSSNVELIVCCDSAFQYKTCAIISKGIWTTKNDSLFLNVSESRWTNDSLNQHGYKGTWPKIPSKPIGFKIIKDQLERIDVFRNGDKSITRLKFINH
jgi:hypothetical protein